jgi:4'-phosphopantetheinyl transferase
MLQMLQGNQAAEPPPESRDLHAAFDEALTSHQWSTRLADRVYVALFDLGDWLPWLADARALLDASEVRRADSRRNAEERDRLALAYALHRLLLGHWLGCNAREVPIRRDAMGCPRLPGEVLFTSLSHASEGLALAVSTAGPVGVDIEPATRASAMPEIAERVCHPQEVAAMADLMGEASSEALLALWVRKEAFLKAAGVGLQYDMTTFAAPDRAVLELPGGGLSEVRMLHTNSEWFAAVAAVPELIVECVWLCPSRPDDQ